MITLNDFIKKTGAVYLTPSIDPTRVEISDAYVSDMLSDVMGNAKPGQVWITIMKHLNVIAVASMTGVAAIIFAKDSTPDKTLIDKALEEEICLVQSSKPVFELAGLLYRELHPN